MAYLWRIDSPLSEPYRIEYDPERPRILAPGEALPFREFWSREDAVLWMVVNARCNLREAEEAAELAREAVAELLVRYPQCPAWTS